MRSKESVLNELYKFHIVQWINHCIKQAFKGILICSIYGFLKSVVLWQSSTILFYKYEKALFACLAFYVILQLLRNAPRLIDSLRVLDTILGHNRASTLWQYKESTAPVKELMTKDVESSIATTLKPWGHYIESQALVVILSVMLLIGSVVVAGLPSDSRNPFQEKIAYNNALKKNIEGIEKKLAETSNEELVNESGYEQQQQVLEDKLIEGIKKSFTAKEALAHIQAYEKAERALMEKIDSEMATEALRDQPVDSVEQLDKVASSLLDKVKDAVKDQGAQEEKRAEEEAQTSLSDSFSELMSQESSDLSESQESNDNVLSSESRGVVNNDSKDGQGGSGQAYGDGAEYIVEEEQAREIGTAMPFYESGDTLVQVSNGSEEDYHTSYGTDLDASVNETMIHSNTENKIECDGKTIQLPSGIPKNRLHLIKAYYEGENEQ